MKRQVPFLSCLPQKSRQKYSLNISDLSSLQNRPKIRQTFLKIKSQSKTPTSLPKVTAPCLPSPVLSKRSMHRHCLCTSESPPPPTPCPIYFFSSYALLFLSKGNGQTQSRLSRFPCPDGRLTQDIWFMWSFPRFRQFHISFSIMFLSYHENLSPSIQYMVDI